MPLTGCEPTIPASERPQTHTLDRAATGINCLRSRAKRIMKHYRYRITFFYIILTQQSDDTLRPEHADSSIAKQDTEL